MCFTVYYCSERHYPPVTNFVINFLGNSSIVLQPTCAFEEKKFFQLQYQQCKQSRQEITAQHQFTSTPIKKKSVTEGALSSTCGSKLYLIKGFNTPPAVFWVRHRHGYMCSQATQNTSNMKMVQRCHETAG